ncbi:MAG: hypothetical protein AB1742_04065 [bacterium]
MTTKEKIFKTIDEIPEDRYPDLFEVVEDFKKRSAEKKCGKWTRFAGILTDEEADAMLAVIEDTCERIDYE